MCLTSSCKVAIAFNYGYICSSANLSEIKYYFGLENLICVLCESCGKKTTYTIPNIIFLGAYVPLTREGLIVVDGVLASCYADFDHDLAHLIMTPMQRFSKVMQWIFGDDTGFAIYVNTARELGILLLPDAQYWSY